ncbi:MAG: S8 family serine peptidase [Parashewanella sp.]
MRNQLTTYLNKLAVATVVAYALPIVAFAQHNPKLDVLSPKTNEHTARYIIKFKTTPSSSDQFDSTASEQLLSAQKQQAIKIVKNKRGKKINRTNMYTAKLNATQLQQLKNNSAVEYIEKDLPRYAYSYETTSGPAIASAIKLAGQASSKVSWGVTAVSANNVSDEYASNRTICIIDTGYDINHPALANNPVSGTSVDDLAYWGDPVQPHGTHVAGIISASAPKHSADDYGVRGVLPHQNINIFSVRALNDEGQASSSGIISAVEQCADNGANVISMSLGGPTASKAEQETYQKIADQGILVIAAAGNAGDTTKSYPASYDSVMSVASVDSANKHSAFSQSNSQVEISAPGEAIISSVPVGKGRLANITLNGKSFFADGIVPQSRKVYSDETNAMGQRPLIDKNINGSISAPLAVCNTNKGKYDCQDMQDKVCLVQRISNQQTNKHPQSTEDIYPEVRAINACQQAGATASIVYSNRQLKGLQNPFLVDLKGAISIPSVSVDYKTGSALVKDAGQKVTVNVENGQDYDYYNGTSMATPFVSGVAALVWSYHPDMSAKELRKALDENATHLGKFGRNAQYGFGLINAKATIDALNNK